MTARILIPLDESETARNTIKAVLDNRDILPRQITLLHVVDVQLVQRLVPDIQKHMVYDAAEKSGQRMLDELAKPFLDAGFEPECLLSLGTPGEAILQTAEEQNVQLVIIGRHPGSGGFRDIMFGSVANHVIRNVNCPVLLI